MNYYFCKWHSYASFQDFYGRSLFLLYSLFPYFMKIAFDLQVIYKTSIKNTQYL